MDYFQEIQNRTTLNNLTAFLLTGTDTDETRKGSREERLDYAYNNLFSRLVSIFPGADEDNDELYGIILDFAVLLEGVYFEAGVQSGFQLYKHLDTGAPGISPAPSA